MEQKMTTTGYKAPEESAARKAKQKALLLNFSPLIALALLAAFFFIVVIKEEIRLNAALEVVINNGVIVAVVATGVTLIYTLGSFDISLGASICVNCMVTTLAYIRTQNLFVAMLVSLLMGVGISVLESTLSSVFKVPVFVTTIASMNILSALSLFLDGKYNGTWNYRSLYPEAYERLGNLGSSMGLTIALMIIFLVICFLIFNLTKVGRQAKFAGGNPVCARLSGVRTSKLSLLAFALSGVGVALATFMTISYSPVVSTTTGGSIGMDILVAIVFGGMPISGGPKSKIHAALIGAFSMSFLKRGLYYLGFSVGGQQMVLAVLFILVVYLTTLNYRTSQLNR